MCCHERKMRKITAWGTRTRWKSTHINNKNTLIRGMRGTQGTLTTLYGIRDTIKSRTLHLELEITQQKQGKENINSRHPWKLRGGREPVVFSRSHFSYFSSQPAFLTSLKWSFCIRWCRPCWRRPGTLEEDIMERKRRGSRSSSHVVVEQLITTHRFTFSMLWYIYLSLHPWIVSPLCMDILDI